jgi:hypothetical protein
MLGVDGEHTAAASRLSRLPSGPPGLYRLPRELRDLIFDEVWRLEKFFWLNKIANDGTKSSITIRYDPPKNESLYIPQDHTPGLPVWLRTSTIVLKEGLCQLYRHAHWCWSHHLSKPPHVGRSNPLAGVSKATNWTVTDSHFADRRFSRSDPTPRVLEIKEHPAAALVPLLSSHLRVLALRFSILQGHNNTVVMNLARFGRIDLRLSKLTVFLGVIMMMRPGIGTAEETNAAFAATWAHAASEVAQIGEAWVGEKRTVVLSVSALIPGVDYSEFGEVAVEHTEYKEVRRHHRMTFKIVRADG